LNRVEQLWVLIDAFGGCAGICQFAVSVHSASSRDSPSETAEEGNVSARERRQWWIRDRASVESEADIAGNRFEFQVGIWLPGGGIHSSDPLQKDCINFGYWNTESENALQCDGVHFDDEGNRLKCRVRAVCASATEWSEEGSTDLRARGAGDELEAISFHGEL
jgi:hypothetical protein